MEASIQAREALEQSGLNLDDLSEVQRLEIITKLEETISQAQNSLPPEALSSLPIDLGCLGCQVGLHVIAGGLIAGLVAGGVAVGPTTAGVVTIAGYVGAEVGAVVTIINSGLAAGGKAVVSRIISELCERLGACRN